MCIHLIVIQNMKVYKRYHSPRFLDIVSAVCSSNITSNRKVILKLLSIGVKTWFCVILVSERICFPCAEALWRFQEKTLLLLHPTHV